MLLLNATCTPASGLRCAARRPAVSSSAAVARRHVPGASRSAGRRPGRAPICCRADPSDEGTNTAEQSAGVQQEDEAQPDNPFQPPHTGRNSPMSEDKRAATVEQMAAPEGDRAIAGQAWQPTGNSAETPEERFGSAEAAQEFAEASKDRTKGSELQTNDEQAQAPGGGMTGEGSSA